MLGSKEAENNIGNFGMQIYRYAYECLDGMMEKLFKYIFEVDSHDFISYKVFLGGVVR